MKTTMTTLAGASLALLIGTCAASAQAVAPKAGRLTAASFGNLTYADFEAANILGCSFAVSRGKKLLGLFLIDDPKKTAAFKIDGRVLTAPAGGRKNPASYWNGTVADHEIDLIKGKADPGTRKNGIGRMKWRGPTGSGSLSVRWAEGC